MGRIHLEIDPNFASDGSQSSLNHKDIYAEKRVTLKGTDSWYFDGNSRGISDHFTGRSAPHRGVLAPLGPQRLLSRPAKKGSRRTRNFGPFSTFTGPLFEARDPVSADRETGIFVPQGARQNPLVWGLATCKMVRNSSRSAVKKSPKIPNPARKPTTRILPPSTALRG